MVGVCSECSGQWVSSEYVRVESVVDCSGADSEALYGGSGKGYVFLVK